MWARPSFKGFGHSAECCCCLRVFVLHSTFVQGLHELVALLEYWKNVQASGMGAKYERFSASQRQKKGRRRWCCDLFWAVYRVNYKATRKKLRDEQFRDVKRKTAKTEGNLYTVYLYDKLKSTNSFTKLVECGSGRREFQLKIVPQTVKGLLYFWLYVGEWTMEKQWVGALLH